MLALTNTCRSGDAPQKVTRLVSQGCTTNLELVPPVRRAQALITSSYRLNTGWIIFRNTPKKEHNFDNVPSESYSLVLHYDNWILNPIRLVHNTSAGNSIWYDQPSKCSERRLEGSRNDSVCGLRCKPFEKDLAHIVPRS